MVGPHSSGLGRGYVRPRERRSDWPAETVKPRVTAELRAARRQLLQYGNRPSVQRSADRVNSVFGLTSPHRAQNLFGPSIQILHSLFHDVEKQMPSRTFPHCLHQRGCNLRLITAHSLLRLARCPYQQLRGRREGRLLPSLMFSRRGNSLHLLVGRSSASYPLSELRTLRSLTYCRVDPVTLR